jgi:hypothetical protein
MPLIIKGFKKQNIISIESVVESVAALPKLHIQGLSTVVYDPIRFYQRSYAQPRSINYRVKGEYGNTPIDHIVIYKFTHKDEFEHILYHEVGHHIFRRVLDSVKRKKWVTEIYPNSNHVSEYAKTNASEDFAETYAFYIKQRERLIDIPSKLAFLNQYL